MEMRSPDHEDLASAIKPGDPKYRAYVGQPEDTTNRRDGVQSPDTLVCAASFAAWISVWFAADRTTFVNSVLKPGKNLA